MSYVENALDKKLNVMSLSYNRLMNHVRYMVARQMSGEVLKLDMNDYMGQKFRKSFRWQHRSVRSLEKRYALSVLKSRDRIFGNAKYLQLNTYG